MQRGVTERFEMTLGLDGRHAAAARRGDGLPVRVVLHVTAREDTLHRGPGGVGAREDVAVLVEIELTAEERGVGGVSDRDEQPGDRELGLLAVAGVTQTDAGELAVAEGLDHLAVPAELHLRVRETRAPA